MQKENQCQYKCCKTIRKGGRLVQCYECGIVLSLLQPNTMATADVKFCAKCKGKKQSKEWLIECDNCSVIALIPYNNNVCRDCEWELLNY